MDDLLPKILGLIAFLGALAIIAVLIIALFRPKVLPEVASMFERIVLALISRTRQEQIVQQAAKRKRKPTAPDDE